MSDLSSNPLYVQYYDLPSSEIRPLGGGPATYRTIPRMQTKVDARTLGYADPRFAIDMQLAKREGDDGGKPPAEVPKQEQT